MITTEIEINGTEFRVTLTEQLISQVNNLKNLYSMAYEDPESFEQVSSQISSTIQEIATAVDPAASDDDLDGLIQEIIKVVDKKAVEMEQAISGHTKSARHTKRKKGAS